MDETDSVLTSGSTQPWMETDKSLEQQDRCAMTSVRTTVMAASVTVPGVHPRASHTLPHRITVTSLGVWFSDDHARWKHGWGGWLVRVGMAKACHRKWFSALWSKGLASRPPFEACSQRPCCPQPPAATFSLPPSCLSSPLSRKSPRGCLSHTP